MTQKLRRSKGGPLWAIWKDAYTIKWVSSQGAVAFALFSLVRVSSEHLTVLFICKYSTVCSSCSLCPQSSLHLSPVRVSHPL